MIAPAKPSLTPEQFLFWLKGFLEAHPDPHVAADRIAAKAQEVQTSQPLGWPYVQQPFNVPVTWCGDASAPVFSHTGSWGQAYFGNPPDGQVVF